MPGRRGQPEKNRRRGKEQGQGAPLRDALLPLLEYLERRHAQPCLRHAGRRRASPSTSRPAISIRRRWTSAETRTTRSLPTGPRSPSSATSTRSSRKAIGTNNDVFVTPVQGGAIRPVTTNKANDNQPLYSPDGKYLAYRAMARPGYESDKLDSDALRPGDAGKPVNLTAGLDVSVERDVLGQGRLGPLFRRRRKGPERAVQESSSPAEKSKKSWTALTFGSSQPPSRRQNVRLPRNRP